MLRKIDEIDRKILRELLRDAAQPQRELADKVNLSQNACWRRINSMRESGLINRQTLHLNAEALGFGLVVFMMVQTRNHSVEWLAHFRTHVSSIPDVTDFYRIGGDYDYLLKIVTKDMKSYDHVYQRLIEKLELEKVTSYFSMEAIIEARPMAI